VFEVLFEAGADPKHADSFGKNAFHYLMFSTNLMNAFEVADCLAAHGVDINAVNKDSETPLIRACLERSKMVSKVLQLGADPNCLFRGQNCFTLLSEESTMAESNKYFEVLFRHGFDISMLSKKEFKKLTQKYIKHVLVKQNTVSFKVFGKAYNRNVKRPLRIAKA